MCYCVCYVSAKSATLQLQTESTPIKHAVERL